MKRQVTMGKIFEKHATKFLYQIYKSYDPSGTPGFKDKNSLEFWVILDKWYYELEEDWQNGIEPIHVLQMLSQR